MSDDILEVIVQLSAELVKASAELCADPEKRKLLNLSREGIAAAVDEKPLIVGAQALADVLATVVLEMAKNNPEHAQILASHLTAHYINQYVDVLALGEVRH